MMARHANSCLPEHGFITSLLVGRPQIQERVRGLRGVVATAVEDADDNGAVRARRRPPPDQSGPADEPSPAPPPRPNAPQSGAHATDPNDVAFAECAEVIAG
jgi:hypothetical protein